jgi:hypothetical protein
MTDLEYVLPAQGRPQWALAAHDVLSEVASNYGGLVTYSQLAAEVQERTGLRTRAAQRNWIGSVLAEVVQRCHGEGLPPLSSLVVRKDNGEVGDGYDEVLRVTGADPLENPLERERHAAGARLRCYQRFARDVPSNARAQLSPVFARTVERRRAAARADQPAVVCPTCYLQLPATGFCPNCA